MIEDGPPFIIGRDLLLGDRTVYWQFECDLCRSLFSTATTETEANLEYLRSGQPASEGISSVCDGCYEYVMTRARADGLT